jgi:hypothetical protein
MKITSQTMSEFIAQNPIRKVVFTPMLMGEINARLFCENDNEITIDIHDPWVIKFFKWEFIIGRVLVTSINGVRCNYSLPIKDKTIKKMLFNGIKEERKNHSKREENLFAKIILKLTHVEPFVTEIDGVQFIELKNHYDTTR